MECIEERFRSRFEWGLIADIQPPDYETRMAILRKNAEMYDKEIDDEIIQYIATNIKSNIRELEGALNKVDVQNLFVLILLQYKVTNGVHQVCFAKSSTAI